MGACCTYHRPTYLSKLLNRSHKKASLLTKHTEEFSLKKRSGEWASMQKKKKGRKSNRTRQKNMRGDSKMESNDSPEIRDREETSSIPGLLSGGRPLSKRPERKLFVRPVPTVRSSSQITTAENSQVLDRKKNPLTVDLPQTGGRDWHSPVSKSRSREPFQYHLVFKNYEYFNVCIPFY